MDVSPSLTTAYKPFTDDDVLLGVGMAMLATVGFVVQECVSGG